MKIHPITDKTPSAFDPIDAEIQKLEVGKVLPIECVDLAERKQVWDKIYYRYPDLILSVRQNFIFISKGNFHAARKRRASKPVSSR